MRSSVAAILFISWQLLLVPTTNANIFDDSRALGRGLNLGNALEAPNEGDWGIVLQPWHFSTIAAGGFDSVRVPINWAAHADDSAPFAIEPNFFDRIDWVIDQAQANGLNAIINIHHYDGINRNPAAHRDRYLALWNQIATRYQQQPRSVYFELLNEPNDTGDNRLDAAAWNSLLADGLAVVRQTNPDRPVIVGPSPWNGWWNINSLELPEDENLIGTFHYYDPFQFTHQGAEWVQGSDAWLGTTWAGTPAERAAIDNAFDAIETWADNENVPIFLGEFGAYQPAAMDDRARWTDYIRSAAEQRDFSWASWEFGAGFGAYDRNAMQWIEPIRQALMPSGDYNGDEIVDLRDYTHWRDALGKVGTDLPADGDDSGQIDLGDYHVWDASFGIDYGTNATALAPIPESTAVYLLLLSMLLLACGYTHQANNRC